MAPRVWHGYCLTFHQARGERKVYVDAEEVLADVMVDNTARDIPEWFINNITFVPKGYSSDWTGLDKMTDINIWNITLAPGEVE